MNIPYTLQWKIIDRGRIYNPVTKMQVMLKRDMAYYVQHRSQHPELKN